MIRISLRDNLFNVLFCYIFGLSADFGGEGLLVNIKDHANETVGLVSLKNTTVIRIILLPDLINNMLNNQLIL